MAKKKPGPAAYSLAFAREASAADLTLDERGLLPLAAARELVASVSAFERDGTPNADTIWAALLSLEDAAEFSREASRLAWRFPHLRGWDNEDAVIRYGAGALPWLETLLDRQCARVGAVPALPFYFVGTHLLAIGPEAVTAILRTRREGESDATDLAFVRAWLARHGSPAWGALAELAVEGHGPARGVLDALSSASPSQVKKHVTASLGKAAAARLLGDATLEASAILAVLDAAASADVGDRVPWPTLVASAGHFEYHALRVVAVRAKKGDDWGILIEMLQGDICDRQTRWPAVVQQYTYGSRVASGGAYLEDARPFRLDPEQLQLDADAIAALDLRPGRSITGAVEHWPSVLAIRATLARERDEFFPPAAEVATKLGIRGAEILLDVADLQHVDGVCFGQGALRALPSQSPAWRSIAEVIATRDPSKLDVGEINTDWRLHATKTQKI